MQGSTTIFGEYDKYGYRIYTNTGEHVYAAGNHQLESTLVTQPGIGSVTLRKLRSYCIQTAREMAVENDWTYGGVQRVNL